MGFSEKSVTLKLTAAIVVDGTIVTAGNLVEMMESEAKDLLRRGKAVLHGEPNDEAPADDAAASEAAAKAAAEDAKAAGRGKAK